MSQLKGLTVPMNLPRPGYLLRLYSALGSVSLPLWRIAMKWRLRRGKEHPVRVEEKFGVTSVTRPGGPIVWLHGVSVGEAMALRAVIIALGEARPDLHFLLTSSTTASADALKQNGLPPRTIHQFAPADTRSAVDTFLAHWRPDAIAFSERDFWPGLIRWSQEWGSQRGVHPLLINSRMSEASFVRRRRAGRLFQDLLGGFPHILLQDTASLARFKAIGAKEEALEVVGSMKVASPPLPDTPALSAAFRKALSDRPCWVAASTHRQEVQTIVKAHIAATELEPRLLTVVAPRKPEVFELQAQALQDAGLTVAMRSSMPDSLRETDALVIDTIGEMGVWLRASNLVFMGFSLPDEGQPLTGKNPYEALAVGSVVVHGPDTTTFAEDYATLDAAGATRQVNSVSELASMIAHRDEFPTMQAAGAAFLANGRAPLERTVEAILHALDKSSA
ncbi:MAG: glycosyltransferase N-terminal domain-containing protein [Pseudomonadota bacterium]